MPTMDGSVRTVAERVAPVKERCLDKDLWHLQAHSKSSGEKRYVPASSNRRYFASLEGGQVFTKLNFAHAYQQVLLADCSNRFVTISASRGLFQYNCLPFGVAAAPSSVRWRLFSMVYHTEVFTLTSHHVVSVQRKQGCSGDGFSAYSTLGSNTHHVPICDSRKVAIMPTLTLSIIYCYLTCLSTFQYQGIPCYYSMC